MDEKQKRVLHKIKEYKSLESEYEALPNPYDAGYDDASEQRGNIIQRQITLVQELSKTFHILFRDYSLRYVIQRIFQHSDKLAIGQVVSENHEPKETIFLLEELQALDKALVSGEMHYVWHLETAHFDDGGICIQAYFCSSDLYKEWDIQHDALGDQECDKRRWIAPEVQMITPFLEKYQDDPRLIEVWSAYY